MAPSGAVEQRLVALPERLEIGKQQGAIHTLVAEPSTTGVSTASSFNVSAISRRVLCRSHMNTEAGLSPIGDRTCIRAPTSGGDALDPRRRPTAPTRRAPTRRIRTAA